MLAEVGPDGRRARNRAIQDVGVFQPHPGSQHAAWCTAYTKVSSNVKTNACLHRHDDVDIRSAKVICLRRFYIFMNSKRDLLTRLSFVIIAGYAQSRRTVFIVQTQMSSCLVQNKHVHTFMMFICLVEK